MSNSINNTNYGHMDTSYRAAGELVGLRKLSIDFYQIMDELPEVQKIREMHEESLLVMIDKLSLFLSMWLGGPHTYREKYRMVGMPQAHRHLIINEAERDMWLLCMDKALELQEYREGFKDYLKKQFRFPAEMILKTSRNE